MATAAVTGEIVVDVKRDRLVILASSLGTIFEWYDFFVYGTKSGVGSVIADPELEAVLEPGAAA